MMDRNLKSVVANLFAINITRFCAFALLLLLSSCVSLGVSGTSLYKDDQWLIMPMSNNSGVATAADVSESLVEANLRARGIQVIHHPKGAKRASALRVKHSLNEQSVVELLNQYKDTTAKYAITGHIEQWGRLKLNGLRCVNGCSVVER